MASISTYFDAVSRESRGREQLLMREREAFYCHKDTGIILPGETVDTPFTFMSKGWAGKYSNLFSMLSLYHYNDDDDGGGGDDEYTNTFSASCSFYSYIPHFPSPSPGLHYLTIPLSS